MKIGIIGGGAAGMATAYLLSREERHHVTVLEKQPMLGGNIRTLNKNVCCDKVADGVYLDNGVIEFQRDHFIHFNRLMEMLDVELTMINGGATSLFLENGRFFQTPAVIKRTSSGVVRWQRYLQLLPLLYEYGKMWRRMDPRHYQQHAGRPISDFITDKIPYRWMKMLLMYGYSIPYAKIDQFPAEIAFSILRHSSFNTRWNRITGGVYSYIEKILEQFTGDVHCNVTIQQVVRRDEQVVVLLADGQELLFDKLVIATPPDQVLKILQDADEVERSWFGKWEQNVAETIIHTDLGLYDKYNTDYYSEFDLFEKENGRAAGYNAYLNRLAGLPENAPHYSLAYNLTERIDPTQIIHRQTHYTPLYTAQALQNRDEIVGNNGYRHIFYAGAYLGNGLHEGAIESAFRIDTMI